MLSYRLGTVNDFHWGLKQVFRYIANLTLTQHLLEIKIKVKYVYSFYNGHQEHEQNDRKEKKESTFLKW